MKLYLVLMVKMAYLEFNANFKQCLLSRSPNPFSYLSHVWSKSTEPSTLCWMTVKPASIEWAREIFQVRLLLYKSHTSCLSTVKYVEIGYPLSCHLF